MDHVSRVYEVDRQEQIIYNRLDMAFIEFNILGFCGLYQSFEILGLELHHYVYVF